MLVLRQGQGFDAPHKKDLLDHGVSKNDLKQLFAGNKTNLLKTVNLAWIKKNKLALIVTKNEQFTKIWTPPPYNKKNTKATIAGEMVMILFAYFHFLLKQQ